MSTSREEFLRAAAPSLRGEVAIIGMACTYPAARDLPAFWRNIVNKVDAVREVPRKRWDPDVFYDPDPTAEGRLYCKVGGYLGESFAFNPLKYGTMPKAIEGAEPDQFLVLRCVHEAMADAGYLDRDFSGLRAEFILGRGNYLGAGLSSLLQRGMITEQTLDIVRSIKPDLTDAEIERIRKEMRSYLPSFSSETAGGLIPNISAGRVANRLDFMGANFTVDAACASTLIAAELAVRNLLSGQTDFALIGGVHIFTNVPFLMVFSALGALSHTSVCRPFDKDCDGTIAGEGVGILALKRLADAERDGDRIYAVIKGVGSASDGRALSVTAPRADGEELALRRAYEMSGVPTGSVALLEAHGTGTSIGDATELEALRRVFGARPGPMPTVALGSIKSMIGHAMPAAGAASLIKTVLALYHRVLPPTLHCREPHDDVKREDSCFYVNSETRPWVHGGSAAPRRAGVDAFGFGGINAHVVLEEYRLTEPAARRSLMPDWDTEVCILEADSREALARAADRLRDYARIAERVPLRDVAYTLNTALSEKAHRLAVVASSLTELADRLDAAAHRLRDPAVTQIKDTQGIYYTANPLTRDGKLAFLFPGEGAQYVNMLSDLCLHFPEVQACFDAADRAAQSPDRYPPSADIFPPPFFNEDEAAAAEARLWRIERATEAMLTADGAMYTLLQGIGLRADMVAGHSSGEWAAMVAAGILDVDEFVGGMARLDEMYRRVQADTTIPRAAMLAVGADRDKVTQLIEAIDCTVHVANDNCPHQVVVVVEQEAADRVVKHLQTNRVFVERLPFDRGYHTPMFTYICGPLREFFGSLTMSPPKLTAYCCTTAAPFPDEPAEILDLASDTFARPIVFREMIERMYDAGARIFVEVGPRNSMTGFVDDILRGRPHLAAATNMQRRSGIASLNHALGQLAAHHVALDFEALYQRREPRRLAFDPEADQPIDEDAAPGTIRVPIYDPSMHVERRPAEGDHAPPPADVASPPMSRAPLPVAPVAAAQPKPTAPTQPVAAPPSGAPAAMQQHFAV
ncbi:MAG: type I polyketide synthase, partial [Phycisphaerae bacterium]